MLKIDFPDVDLFDQQTERFFSATGGTFTFEHSLFAVAKWEYKYCKPFLVEDQKRTQEEWLYYFKCMCTDQNFNTTLVTDKTATILLDYINSNHTATKIAAPKHDSRKVMPYISSELVYANMAQSGVPFSADKWNLSRLFAVLGIISAQNTPPEDRKMSPSEVRQMQHDLNVKRRKELNSNG